MPRCALPDHLKDRRHNDWLPGLSWIPRSFNATGPRCGAGNPGYRAWPPRLVEGYGVTRWETSGADSIIEIPSFSGDVDANIYGKTVDAREMKPGHPRYGERFRVQIRWEPLLIQTDGSFKPGDLNVYSPSAIQYFSKKGWMRLDPDYCSTWNWFWRWPHGEPKGFFTRRGHRPDHLDIYYNKSLFPYVGMNGE